MQASYPVLIEQIDRLMVLHQKNDCVWMDFFATAKERLLRDPAFGRDYVITAWGGMFNYEVSGVLEDQQDEALRLQIADTVYHLAKELKS